MPGLSKCFLYFNGFLTVMNLKEGLEYIHVKYGFRRADSDLYREGDGKLTYF